MKNRSVSLWVLLSGFLALFYLGVGCGVDVTLCKQGQECLEGERCFSDRCLPAIAEGNKPPVSRAGRTQRVRIGDIVRLDGSASTDADLDHLTFLWSFGKRPIGSKSKLNNENNALSSFIADAPGVYTVKLTVTDSIGAVDVSDLTIKINAPPKADAGGDLLVLPGAEAVLWGDGSEDLDRDDTLEYRWRILKRPRSSKAVLKKKNTVTTSLVADKPGTFSIELQVSDGIEESTDIVLVKVADPTKITPVLKRLDPTSAPMRSTLKVALHGSGFIQGASVFFQGHLVHSVYRSSSKVIASIDLRKVGIGKYKIKLSNPRGKETSTLYFRAKEIPIPQVKSISPKVLFGDKAVRVLINGEGFVDGAHVFFNGLEAKSTYIRPKQMEANLSVTGLKTGHYPLFVENIKGKRSLSIQVKVEEVPERPFILKHEFSSKIIEVDKKYDYLRLYGSNITNTTKVRINGVMYKGRTQVGSNLGLKFVSLLEFHTINWSPTRHRFFLINPSRGGDVESLPHAINFGDPEQPKVNSVFFHEGNAPVEGKGHTQKIYQYLNLQGTGFVHGLEVYINGLRYTGSVSWTSRSRVLLPGFETMSMSVGRYSIFIKNVKAKRKNVSNSVTFYLENGRTPLVFKVDSSETIIETDHTYNFLRITGNHLFKETKIYLDGKLLINRRLLQGSKVLFLYKFKTDGFEGGQHILILKNTFGKSLYESKIFLFKVVDKRNPILHKVSFEGLGSAFKDERHFVKIDGLNLSLHTQVLIDGNTYKGKVSSSNNRMLIRNFSTVGLSTGHHIFQLRNVVNQKNYLSNSKFFEVKERKPLFITGLSPQFILERKDQRLSVMINPFHKGSKIYVDGKEHQILKFNSRSQLLNIDGQKLGKGVHTVQVKGPGSLKSNIKKFKVNSVLPPLLWEIHPHVFFKEEVKSSHSSALLVFFRGAFLLSGAQVFAGKVLVGSLIVPSGSDNGRAFLDLSRVMQKGQVLFSIRNPGGQVSNTSEAWFSNKGEPMIHSASLSARSYRMFIYGRNFSSKSTVLINKKPFSILYSMAVDRRMTGRLEVFLSKSVWNAKSFEIVVKSSGREKSTPFYINDLFQLTKCSFPQLPDSIPSTGLEVLFSGTQIHSSHSIWMNGKKLPTAIYNSSSLSAVMPSTTKLKAGEYITWTLKDKNKSLHSYVSIVYKSFYSHESSPYVLYKSAVKNKVAFSLPREPFPRTVEVFGKSFLLKKSAKGNVEVNLGQVPSQIKPGIHTFRLKGAGGKYSQRVGFYVAP